MEEKVNKAHEGIEQVPGYLEQRRNAKVSAEPAPDLVADKAADIEDERRSEGGLDGSGLALDDVGGTPTNLERRGQEKY